MEDVASTLVSQTALPGLLALLCSWLGAAAAAPGPPRCRAQSRHVITPGTVAWWDLMHKDLMLGGGGGMGQVRSCLSMQFQFLFKSIAKA